MASIRWLASYPKSGNTWLRVFVANLLADQDRPVGINEIGDEAIASHRGWLDEVLGFSTAHLTAAEVDRVRPAVYAWSARDFGASYCKVHDAWSLTADGVPLFGSDASLGALYILRNPLDVASSLANHLGVDVDAAIEKLGNPDGAFSEVKRGLPSQVRQHLGTWSTHVLSWVDQAVVPCMALRYEDMLTTPVETFGRAAGFLGLPVDPQRIARAVAHCSFSELRSQEDAGNFVERPAVATRFFRRGGSGHWREELTPAQVDRIVADHGAVMARFGYLDDQGRPR